MHLGYGLAPNKRQAITSIKKNTVHRCSLLKHTKPYIYATETDTIMLQEK